jgi:hypothetical protein
MNPERHEKYFALIPAYLSQQLSTVEAAEAALHFEQCDDCLAELNYARQLHNHFQHGHETATVWEGSDASPHVDASWLSPAHEQQNFDRLWSRIEYNTSTTAKVATTAEIFRRPWFWVAIAAGLIFAGVLSIYKGAFEQEAIVPEYRTLADSTARINCGQLRIRFVDNFSAVDLQNLLQSVDAHIVDGPTPHGVYTLRSGMPTNAALQKLHLHPAVALAEPTDC